MASITNKKLPKILIIAGSDSSAGAGIQADLKSSSANGVYAATVITAITAQNTLGVQDVFDIPLSIITAQIKSVMDDLKPDYVKLGMLSNVDTIKVVSKKLAEYENIKIVADPVMIAKGGHSLLGKNAVKALKNNILNNAFLITPNIPEAELLGGIGSIKTIEDMNVAVEKISQQINCEYILLKGGHLEGENLCDILYSRDEAKVILALKSKRIDTKNTHGTGCTLASAITSNLAKGEEVTLAVKNAHKYVHEAIKLAPEDISSSKAKSHGPINHFPFKFSW